MRLVLIGEGAVLAERIEDAPEIAREVAALNAAMYEKTGFEPPWVAYLAVVDGRTVGTCAFKSAPRDEEVEIAYFTFPDHEGKGLGTRMAGALIELARATAPGVKVTAQTLPAENASTRILRKLGFVRAGTGHDEEAGTTWVWRLD